MKEQKWLAILIVVLSLLLVAACGGGGSESTSQRSDGTGYSDPVEAVNLLYGIYIDPDSFEGSDREKLQKAVDYAKTVKGIVVICRDYYVDGSVVIKNSVRAMGISSNTTRILSSTTSGHILVIQTDEAVTLEDIGVFYNIGPAQGERTAAIYVTGADGGGANVGSKFYRILTENGYYGIQFVRAYHWLISDSKIHNAFGSNILVENKNNPDEGDSQITGCVFENARPESNALLHWRSSGGLRITNNKFISSGQYGLLFEPNYYATTCDILVQNNSIENQYDAGIAIRHIQGALLYVLIQNNQIASPNANFGIAQYGSGYLYDLQINNNVIGLSKSGSTGISTEEATGYIKDNVIDMFHAAGSVGINRNGFSGMKLGDNVVSRAEIEDRQ